MKHGSRRGGAPCTRFGLRSFLLLTAIILSTVQFVNLFYLTNHNSGDTEYAASRYANAGVDAIKLDVIERSIKDYLSSKFQGETSEINEKLKTIMEMVQYVEKNAPHHRSQALTATTKNKENQAYQYTPSPLEKYFIDNAESLGLRENRATATCPLITDVNSPVSKDMSTYMGDLGAYNQLMKSFTPITYDLRTKLERDNSNIEQVCKATKIHSNGLNGVFKRGISSSTHAGGMEPFFATMRSHKICNKGPVSWVVSREPFFCHHLHRVALST